MSRAGAVAALTAATLIAGTGWAAAATVNSAGSDGNPARYTAFWRMQTTGDCVERSALLAMAGIQGSWPASYAGIDQEAYKLGITGAAFNGSTFDASNVALFTHYGFKAAAPRALSRASISADLAAGSSVQATVYAGDLWDGIPVPNDPGFAYSDPNTTPVVDHAVVVEAINKTTGSVVLGDTGVPFGNGEVVSWTKFSQAWSVGGYQAIVISK